MEVFTSFVSTALVIPSVAPTSGPWDLDSNIVLSFERWPRSKGGRVASVLPYGLESGEQRCTCRATGGGQSLDMTIGALRCLPRFGGRLTESFNIWSLSMNFSIRRTIVCLFSPQHRLSFPWLLWAAASEGFTATWRGWSGRERSLPVRVPPEKTDGQESSSSFCTMTWTQTV